MAVPIKKPADNKKKEFKDIAQDLKAFIEWLSVFKNDHDVSDEAYEVLREKLDKIGHDLQALV